MATGTIKQTGATAGACTYNTTFFNTPIYNTIAKCGQVVHVTFLAEVKAEIPNSSWILSELPKTLNNYLVKLPFLFGNTQYIPSPTFYQGGSLTNVTSEAVVTSYAIAQSYVGKFMYLDFTYISEE